MTNDAMRHVEELWPDPDLRDDALERLAARVAVQPDKATLTDAEKRVLEAVSHGLGGQGAADALGIGFETVKDRLKQARRALAAKDTTHAACEAIRQGLIQ